MKMRKALGNTHFIKNLFLLVLVLALASCMQQGDGKRASTKKNNQVIGGGGDGSNGGSGSLPDSGTDGGSSPIQSLKVEILHLVDPFTGTYKKKITIPKNYKGELNLAMTNIAAVQDKLLRVRIFNGHDLQPIDLSATVNRAPGIIPDTEIQVLSVDFNSSPAKTLQLPYNLYDYNDYDADPSLVPVTDNRNGNLYCRGLNLSYDPTYTGTTGKCELSTDKCLYSYAKVEDQTLYQSSNNLTSIPTLPQVWSIGGTQVPSDALAKTSMCLLDAPMDSNDFVSVFQEDINNSATYYYRGPYRRTNTSLWQISNTAINHNKYGIFKLSNLSGDFYSFLFPRSGKLTLQTTSSMAHMGSTDLFDNRVRVNGGLDLTTGQTQYMDGCNLRVTNFTSALNEGMGSCNVSSYIEVYYRKEDNSEVVVTRDYTLKVQFVRASLTNYEGKEVLSSSFKSCANSSFCGNSECCFNNRCWSKDLVSYCVDQVSGNGNFGIGVSCSSDFECSSLCCSSSTGTCQPHDPNNTNSPSMCNKPAGQACVTKEFCKPEYVRICKKVKNGIGLDGKLACKADCQYVETYGSCKNKVCVPPVGITEAELDLTDCSDAVDQ